MLQVTFEDHWKICGAPSRIAWVVAETGGRRSICPVTSKMPCSVEPPMMAVTVGPMRFTHDLISESGEFVLAWPGADLAEATLYFGTHSGRDEDKLAKHKLNWVPGKFGSTPMIEECILNMECRVVGQLTTGDHTTFAGEVIALWANERPGKVLCAIGPEAGYETMLDRKHFRFGVIKG